MAKYNLVVPMNGRGQRMRQAGFTTPKPLIMAGNKTIIDWGLDSIDTSECKPIFIIRRDQPQVEFYLRSRFFSKALYITASKEGEGSLADVVNVAGPHINNDKPLIVFNPDVAFSKYRPQDEDFRDGLILTFKSNSPSYSYVETRDGLAVRTAEKEVISSEATVGLYCFPSGQWVCNNFHRSVPRGREHYVAPIFNALIEDGRRVRTKQVEKMYVMGTPEELAFFNDMIYPTLNPARLFILCSDHSAYEQKVTFRRALENMGVKYIDVGCDSIASCDYNGYVEQACEIRKLEGGFGLAFCRSSQGIGICVNKTDPRAVCCTIGNPLKFLTDTTFAIEHNCANFLAIASRCNFSGGDASNLIRAIQAHTFDGGRHQVRMMKTLGYIK
jgi:NDP-sugar pyrophosphorylase family protein